MDRWGFTHLICSLNQICLKSHPFRLSLRWITASESHILQIRPCSYSSS